MNSPRNARLLVCGLFGLLILAGSGGAAGQTVIPASGLNLWLEADVGTTVDQDGRISVWQDQSGSGNDAFQASSGAQPYLSSNSLSGLPVVHFSGGQALNLPDLMNGAAAGEMFVVMRIEPYDLGTVRGFMRVGSNSDDAHYPLYGGVIADNFGSTTRKDQAGAPEQDLSQYHIYNAISTSTEWTSRINGSLNYTSSVNTVGFSGFPQIGLSQSWYFAGDMAEIIIYNRALSDAERNSVISYLGAKYPDIAPQPSTPTNLQAVSVSGSQSNLTWNYPLTTKAPTQFTVQRKTSASDYSTVATLTDASSYFDTGLDPSQQYTYRVQAMNFKGVSDFSAEAGEVYLPAQTQTEMPLNGMRLWLKADAASGSLVRRWLDQSGGQNDAVQTDVSKQPLNLGNAIGDRPALHFSGGQSLSLPDLMSGAAAGEMFVVMRTDPYDSGTVRGFMRIGSNGDNAHYPLSGGVIADNFGSTLRRDSAGVPVQDLSQFHLYDALSTSAEWTSRLNGMFYYSTSANTVGFSAFPQIGQSQFFYFAGDIAEILIYDHGLTGEERIAVGHYLSGKYPTLAGPAPTAPVDFVAHLISTSQAYLGWSYSLRNYNTTFVIERSQAGGSFAEIARVRNQTSFVDSALELNTDYSYRVRAISEAGESEYSNVALIRTENAGAALPLTGIRLWLAADSVTTNPVQSWLSSGLAGSSVAGWQADPTRRPSLIPNSLHGKPVVHFNGSEFLSLQDIMSGATAGEMYVVMRCDPYVSNTIRGFMRIGSNGDNAHYPLSGSIKDNFGSTMRQDGSGIALEDLSQYHIYNAVSTPSEWTNRLNGMLNYTTSINTVGFSDSPQIGLSQYYYFAGDIAELIVYDHALDVSEEAAVQKYLSVKYTILDPDDDGLDGDQELALGTDPNNWDSNGDGLADGPEYFAGYDPTNLDIDADGLSNAQELILGTNPFLADTDRDGVLDGQDAFPLDPTRWEPPDPGDPNDHTAPTITLIEPAGATLLQ